MLDALAVLDTLTSPHAVGHLCTGHSPDGLGTWYNPNAGAKEACPTLLRLRDLRAEVERLQALPAPHTVAHQAAHDNDAALYVGAAAAGFTGADCDRAHPDDQVGFTAMGRYALEALAAHLDPEDYPATAEGEPRCWRSECQTGCAYNRTCLPVHLR